MRKHEQREPTRTQWVETTIEVVMAVRSEVIVEAEELEDLQAEDDGAHKQAPNNQR